MDRIYTQMWMSLPRDIRHQLVKDFNIPRTGASEVRDEHVITDGHTNSDLTVFTKESMASYVGYDDTFGRLWEVTIMRASEKVNPPTEEIIIPEQTKEIVVYCKRCAGGGGRHSNGCPLAVSYSTK